jgi:hypothetical protein
MKPFSIIAATIFLLIALIHLYRIAVGFPIMIGATSIGQAVSWAGLIVASVMAVGLFREGLRGNSHSIKLTAQFNPAKPDEIIVTRKTRLARGSKGHHFKFRLDDQTGKNVSFAALTSADDCSTCPPDKTKPNTQIYDVRRENNPPHGQPRTAEFRDRNDNEREMDVSYQWEFTCPDGTKVQPYDPIIANGGKM